MNTYYIKPGIASLVYVEHPDWPKWCINCVYMGPNLLSSFGQQAVKVEWARHSYPIDPETIPLEVRAAVNKHFGTVFSLPVQSREAYLRSLPEEGIAVNL